MALTEGQPAPSRRVVERLYPAVLAAFAENDFHKVNIRQIYRESGISPSTIYKYYPSKEALLFAAIDYNIAQIAREVTVHIQGMEDTREILRKVFWVTLNYYDQNQDVAIAAFITIPLRSWMKEPSYIRHDSHVIIRDVYAHGLQRGELDPALSASDCSDQYFMYCYRQIHKWYFHGRSWRLVDKVPEFFPIFWKTVSAPQTP
ncbi:MAG: TetR/AcrR family transcriptional regulator [Ectothiorhodospiraceae bacterium]|nr:TetR/AcrR family transcriptional regulator [Ectothiorhodospiraceae bacterium]